MENYKDLVNRINEIILESNCEFVIYPFGSLGALVKGILNGLFSIQEKMLIDNKLCHQYKNIKGLDSVGEKELKGCKVLVASDSIEYYEELREQLYKVAEKEQCIEVFPVPDIIKEYYKIKPIINKKMIEEGMSGESLVYHPRKTKSNFCLPLLSTDCIQRTIFLTDDYYERMTLDKVFSTYGNGMLKERINQGQAVLDIGANIGNHALYLCNECGAKKVYCFEPVESTYLVLKENVRLNHLEQKIVLYSIGLGEKEGNAFSAGYSVYNVGGTHLEDKTDGKIQIKKLDDMQIIDRVAFIKIDVEGMESSVLRGGMNLIRENFIIYP